MHIRNCSTCYWPRHNSFPKFLASCLFYQLHSRQLLLQRWKKRAFVESCSLYNFFLRFLSRWHSERIFISVTTKYTVHWIVRPSSFSTNNFSGHVLKTAFGSFELVKLITKWVQPNCQYGENNLAILFSVVEQVRTLPIPSTENLALSARWSFTRLVVPVVRFVL